ncbi:MAG: hypothetical protein GVY28_01275 [Alphaproteobacteria bacterium]|nr:hypothetical protein [Alphaproteobacteria bacterium]
MAALPDRIMNRVRAKGRGRWVCTPRDFLDLGSRAAVDQALSRLAKGGQLRRIGRGLYDLPRVSRILDRPAAADLDQAIAALERRDGVRVVPDGMIWASRLGLTTAVPAKARYLTDGASRDVRIGNRTIRLRHASPSVMAWSDKSSGPVALALRWLGPEGAADPQVAETLKRKVPDRVKRDLARNLAHLPAWALPIGRTIADSGSASA